MCRYLLYRIYSCEQYIAIAKLDDFITSCTSCVNWIGSNSTKSWPLSVIFKGMLVELCGPYSSALSPQVPHCHREGTGNTFYAPGKSVAHFYETLLRPLIGYDKKSYCIAPNPKDAARVNLWLKERNAKSNSWMNNILLENYNKLKHITINGGTLSTSHVAFWPTCMKYEKLTLL